MNQPPLELSGDCALFRPSGKFSLREAVGLITAAIGAARERKLRKLLVVANSLSGFASPGVAERYAAVSEWAAAGQGQVCVAIVLRPEMIHPEKFGGRVAANHGFVFDTFASEEEALAWLRSRPGAE